MTIGSREGMPDNLQLSGARPNTTRSGVEANPNLSDRRCLSLLLQCQDGSARVIERSRDRVRIDESVKQSAFGENARTSSDHEARGPSGQGFRLHGADSAR